jgi:hypothetical protein
MACGKDAGELLCLQQPTVAREGFRSGRQARRLGREPHAALGSAALQDLPAPARAHATAKSMVALTLELARLISAFHGFFLGTECKKRSMLRRQEDFCNQDIGPPNDDRFCLWITGRLEYTTRPSDNNHHQGWGGR